MVMLPSRLEVRNFLFLWRPQTGCEIKKLTLDSYDREVAARHVLRSTKVATRNLSGRSFRAPGSLEQASGCTIYFELKRSRSQGSWL
jgi:hypothetical protein